MSSSQENKTKATSVSVADFIETVSSPTMRADAHTLCKLLTDITGHQPVMWGPSIIGFGQYHYKYDSGREGDMAAIGFSPRKDKLVLYVVQGINNYETELAQLGPHKTSKACLYIKRLSDVDMHVLESILRQSYAYVMAHHNEMGRAT
jgi:hypothetical protein